MSKKIIGGGYVSWLDTVKGLGVYLVILGHLWYKSDLPIINKGIYSFHMPLFFIIAGFVIRTIDRDSAKQYIKKQTTRLLLPTLIFIVAFLPVYYVTVNELDIVEVVKRICFWNGLIPYNDPCWFFIVLYEAKIAEHILNIANRTKKEKIIACILFFVIGYIVYQFDIFLPFGFNKCFVALGFLTCGMLIKDICFRELNKNLINETLFCIAIFLLWSISGILLNSKVSMYIFDLGYYWLFVLSGICGSFLFIRICQGIDKISTFFRVQGQNTIFVICTHYICVTIFKKITGFIGIHYTWIYDISAITFAIVLLCCYLPICTVVNKYLPILNGRGREVK